MCASQHSKMKMAPLLILLYSIQAVCGFAAAQCLFSAVEFSCKQIDINEFLNRFYFDISTVYFPSHLTISIENSNFSFIEYFPHLPVNSKPYNVTSLIIKNSSVEDVSKNAFEELLYLEKLDLSWNELNNLSFVMNLPVHLKNLHLNNNKIKYIHDVFSKLGELQFLDMSHNRLSIVNFASVRTIRQLNFSGNYLITLISEPKSSNEFIFIDLSHNQITKYNETKLGHFSWNIDVSYNNLYSVELINAPRGFLNFAGTNISYLSVKYGEKIVCENIDLSFSRYNNDVLNKFIAEKIILTNNNITKLTNFPTFISSSSKLLIDLTNSSISDLPEYLFSYIDLPFLNLSYNNINLLRNNVFAKSIFSLIDLSHSKISIIQQNAFKTARIKEINLSFNKISNLQNIFSNTSISKIDISFNLLKTISNGSFVKCKRLIVLNISNCFIDKIEPFAFSTLNELDILDLSNNRLFILQQNTFDSLHVTKLKLNGNKISTIKFKAFNNLNNLSYLELSHLNIKHLESNAFFNLSRTVTVDLGMNEITSIPSDLFVYMSNLKHIRLVGNKIETLNPFSNRLKIIGLGITFSRVFTPNRISNVNLRYLILKDSTLEVLKNNSFGGLFNLLELHFNDSHISFIEPGALNDLCNLKMLDSQTLFKYTNHIKQNSFKDLRSLELLNLSSLSLKSIEAKSFEGLKNLQTLLLNGNDFAELYNNTFYGLYSLKVLDLSFSHVVSCSERTFEGLKNLKELYLHYNKLQSLSSDIFYHLVSLQILHLENNQITFISHEYFLSLTNLQELYLQHNKITDLSIGIFRFLPNLKMLNLSENYLKPFANGVFSNLINLEVLDLSNNQIVKFEQEKESIFYSSTKLKELYLDGNSLKQFNFRRLLINLKKITHLGISHNKWKCNDLSVIIESLNNKTVNYKAKKPVYDSENVDGISCVDICKYIYCLNNVDETYSE